MKHRTRPKNHQEPPLMNINNPQGMSSGPYNSGMPGSQGDITFGWGGAIGGILGAAAGTFLAPGVGTAAGYAIGSGLGNSIDGNTQSTNGANRSQPMYGNQDPNYYGAHALGGLVKYDQGGQTQDNSGMSMINVEGTHTQEGTSVDVHKGELLVLNGKIIKNYTNFVPHPKNGTDPNSNTEEKPGSVVVPRKMVTQYINTDIPSRKALEKTLISRQQDRSRKALDVLKNQGLMHPDASIQGNQINTPQDQQQGMPNQQAPMQRKGGYIYGQSKYGMGGGLYNQGGMMANGGYLPGYSQYNNTHSDTQGNLYYNLTGMGYPQVFDHNYSPEHDQNAAYPDNIKISPQGPKMEGKSNMIGSISSNRMALGGNIRPQSFNPMSYDNKIVGADKRQANAYRRSPNLANFSHFGSPKLRYEDGGQVSMYQEGTQYDLSEKEIQNLIKQGYGIKRL